MMGTSKKHKNISTNWAHDGRRTPLSSRDSHWLSDCPRTAEDY